MGDDLIMLDDLLDLSSQDPNLYAQRIRVRLNHNILSTVNAVQCDTSREFYFLFEDYEIPDDAEVRVYVRKPSQKEIYNYCYQVRGEAVFQPTLQTLAEVGEALGQVQIVKNKRVLTSFPFRILVEENLIASSNITSSDEFLILNDLIDNARIECDKIKELQEELEANEVERQEAEALRVSNEASRKKAESARETAESGRVDAEKARVTAENNRVTAESSRTTAETKRVDAETKRETEETKRLDAENLRVTAESTRASAEKTRVSQENTRKTAETNRVNAEKTRVSQENTRKTAETAREEAESTRSSQESTRQSNETKRVDAEKARVTAENNRVTAESSRQENTTTAIDKCNEATERANQAVENIGSEVVKIVINDSASATTSTYSSKKIDNIVSSIFKVSTTEPTSQIINGIWFIEEI